MMTLNFISFILGILLFSEYVDAEEGSKGIKWNPQHGTMQFPKDPMLSPRATRGDVYLFPNGLYYKAINNVEINNMDQSDTFKWLLLERGTTAMPKDTISDTIERTGEIFKDGITRKYYKSHCIPVLESEKALCLEEFKVTSEWMSSLRHYIGDTRLGDLAIPGSHDSGTVNINEDSYLVDKNFLFSLGELVVPEVLVNWSITQDSDLLTQMESGFRLFDLRIADCESYNDTYRWWHGLAADVIDEGLQQIADYATLHPQEILLLEFGHFARPGNADSGTLPILPERKVELSNILLSYLSEHMVPYVNISDNPTVNEVLNTGRNVIAFMHDGDIRALDDRYWPFVPHSAWSGRTNPEDLFTERSTKLNDFLINHSDRMTSLSGCFTPDEKTITGAMVQVYGDHPLLEKILERIAPGVNELEADMMSFEGVFIDLVSTARHGIYSNGMYIRPVELYSNGGSVNYRSMPEMYYYWLARPGKYKPNMLSVDDASETEEIVNYAIRANMDDIPHEASISFQGNSRNGFYYWANFTAYGGEEGVNCKNVQARFAIESEKFSIQENMLASDPYELTMQQGQYPDDSQVTVEVKSQGNDEWVVLDTFGISNLIEEHLDMYIRGDDLGEGHGFAYIGTVYNAFGEECGLPPESGDMYLTIVEW